MGLEKLKIAAAPPAFSEYEKKHNALVTLIETIAGRGGAKVTVTEGRIIIEASSGYIEGDAVEVVGLNGKLNAVVKHSTWATPTDYPSEIRVVSGGLIIQINLANGGVHVDNGSGTTAFVGTGGFGYEDANHIIQGSATGFSIENKTGGTLTIDSGAITENMSIVEDDVCDSGTARRRLVIASEPYDP
jgi:hypothetical protein